MKILRLFQRRLKPRFRCRIYPRLESRGGNGLQKLSVSGKQGDILDIILVVVVEKRHLFVDTLIPQIRVFYDPVVCGVRKLHDSAEPHIHRPVQLVDQDLVLLLHRIRHLL